MGPLTLTLLNRAVRPPGSEMQKPLQTVVPAAVVVQMAIPLAQAVAGVAMTSLSMVETVKRLLLLRSVTEAKALWRPLVTVQVAVPRAMVKTVSS